MSADNADKVHNPSPLRCGQGGRNRATARYCERRPRSALPLLLRDTTALDPHFFERFVLLLDSYDAAAPDCAISESCGQIPYTSPGQSPPRHCKEMTGFSTEKFDVLVIGGGITGCGVARDAAMRGLRVALVERDDFASGTSGRSSRLVHGGIRYLEHGQLHLVRESIRERETLLRIAPHLVEPLAFTWPIYRGARVGKLKLSAGRFFIRWSPSGKARASAMLDAAATLGRESELSSAGLTGGAVYYDARTDDARLTIVNAIAAEQNGAVVLNHVRVTDVIRRGAKAVGAVVVGQYSGESSE